MNKTDEENKMKIKCESGKKKERTTSFALSAVVLCGGCPLFLSETILFYIEPDLQIQNLFVVYAI